MPMMNFTIPALSDSDSEDTDSEDDDTEEDDDMADAPTLPQPTRGIIMLTLPAYLQRPPYKGISKDALAVIDPALRDVQPLYIRDMFTANFDSRAMRTLASVTYESDTGIAGVYPETVRIHVADCASAPPTHVLAISRRSFFRNDTVTASAEDDDTFFPAHQVVLTSYCAKLPMMPSCDDGWTKVTVLPGRKIAQTLEVPIFPLYIPHPSTFAPLLYFMYDRDTDNLHQVLFPCPLPCSHDNIYDTAHEDAASLRVDYARQISEACRGWLLTSYVFKIQGMWENVCALGIEDQTVWCLLDTAWHVMLLAVAMTLKDTKSMVTLVGGKKQAEELALF